MKSATQVKAEGIAFRKVYGRLQRALASALVSPALSEVLDRINKKRLSNANTILNTSSIPLGEFDGVRVDLHISKSYRGDLKLTLVATPLEADTDAFVSNEHRSTDVPIQCDKGNIVNKEDSLATSKRWADRFLKYLEEFEKESSNFEALVEEAIVIQQLVEKFNANKQDLKSNLWQGILSQVRW